MELLVVLVIVGIVTTIAVLSVSLAGADRQLKQEAKRLAALVDMQCEEAVLRGTSYAVTFAAGGTAYAFLRRAGQRWLPRRGEIYHPRRLPDGVHARLWVEGRRVILDEGNVGEPHLVCLSSGTLIPFRLRLIRGDTDTVWQVVGHVDGEVTLEAIHRS